MEQGKMRCTCSVGFFGIIRGGFGPSTNLLDRTFLFAFLTKHPFLTAEFLLTGFFERCHAQQQEDNETCLSWWDIHYRCCRKNVAWFLKNVSTTNCCVGPGVDPSVQTFAPFVMNTACLNVVKKFWSNHVMPSCACEVAGIEQCVYFTSNLEARLVSELIEDQEHIDFFYMALCYHRNFKNSFLVIKIVNLTPCRARKN